MWSRGSRGRYPRPWKRSYRAGIHMQEGAGCSGGWSVIRRFIRSRIEFWWLVMVAELFQEGRGLRVKLIWWDKGGIQQWLRATHPKCEVGSMGNIGIGYVVAPR